MENTNNNQSIFVQSANEEKAIVTKLANEERQRWHMPNLDVTVFKNLILSTLEKYMAQRGTLRPYIIDEYNKDILNQMYLYIIGDMGCRWDLHKGLYLGGKVGAGKTLLMLAFTDILGKISGYNIEMISARQLSDAIRKNGMDRYCKRPLFIDELGRENLEENLYGRQFRPFEELISSRYEYGTRLFLTSNFKPERLGLQFNEEGKRIGYGQYIYDRLKDCCSFDVLQGESKRGII